MPRVRFASDTAFDPELLDYSGAHEVVQAFSPAFRAFASELATGWTERDHLRAASWSSRSAPGRAISSASSQRPASAARTASTPG